MLLQVLVWYPHQISYHHMFYENTWIYWKIDIKTSKGLIFHFILNNFPTYNGTTSILMVIFP
jgi:hypothetical protein